jgi:branched-chain amino acid transport system substrate-binding protein
MNRRDAIKCIAAGAAAIALPARAQEPKRIILGQSAALTGPAARLGLEMSRGARIHFDALNAQGGIHGRLIELRTLDDGYEPERCVANTKALIADDVLALFGYVGTPTSLASMPLIKAAGKPFFGPLTGAQDLRAPFDRSVFHLRASYDDETSVIVKQLTSLGMRRIAVFHQNDSYGMAGLEGVRLALEPFKLTPVALGAVERDSVDVAAAAQGLVAAKPDAIVQISAHKSCAAFIREARKLGYGGLFFNVSFVGTRALSDELGKQARGVIVSQVMPYPFGGTTPIAREYLQALQRSDPEARPDYTSMEGYLAAKVMAAGLRRAGRNPSRDSLIAGLEGLRDVDFGGFRVNFEPGAHAASRYVELSVLTEDGKVRC